MIVLHYLCSKSVRQEQVDITVKFTCSGYVTTLLSNFVMRHEDSVLLSWIQCFYKCSVYEIV